MFPLELAAGISCTWVHPGPIYWSRALLSGALPVHAHQSRAYFRLTTTNSSRVLLDCCAANESPPTVCFLLVQFSHVLSYHVVLDCTLSRVPSVEVSTRSEDTLPRAFYSPLEIKLYIQFRWSKHNCLFLVSSGHQIFSHRHTISQGRSSIILATSSIRITLAIHLNVSTLCKPQPLSQCSLQVS
jgi:hypothetical protein